MSETMKQILERLSAAYPVSVGLRACISEAARRGDMRALAFMNYENADNSDPAEAQDNARLLRKQLENAGLGGAELEEAAAAYHERYEARRSIGDGKILSLPVPRVEELRKDALGRLTQIQSKLATATDEELVRLHNVRAILRSFATSVEKTLSLTRQALVDYVKANWDSHEAQRAPKEPRESIVKAVPDAAPKAAPAAAAPSAAPKAPSAYCGAPRAEYTNHAEHPAHTKRTALLVSLGSPYCNLVIAMLQRLGLKCILAKSNEELGELMKSGALADIAFVLAREDIDGLARIGYCLGMLNSFIGQDKTCLLVEQNSLAMNMGAFANETRLHFYKSPEECERLVKMVAGI